MIQNTKRAIAMRERAKDEMRHKISVTKALTRIALCEKELLSKCDEITGSTVAALRAVMDSNWKKIDKHLPNLQSVQMSGSINITDERELTDDQLLDIATGRSEGVIEAEEGERELH